MKFLLDKFYYIYKLPKRGYIWVDKSLRKEGIPVKFLRFDFQNETYFQSFSELFAQFVVQCKPAHYNIHPQLYSDNNCLLIPFNF